MKNPVHPGRIVKGSIEELGLSVTDAAKVLGVTHPTISPEMAVRLLKAFGSTPKFWLTLQLNYDLAQVKAGEIKVERYEPVGTNVQISLSDPASVRQ